ncbi:MAG: penicillin acylase family protein [Alphaproteobacteria bacterium]|nr:penicillin acylase family protein [Alphaproteobacteria bacterium]
MRNLLVVLILLLGACSGRSPLTPIADGGRCARPVDAVARAPKPGPAPSAKVVIHRDAHGTPYVIGDSDAAAFFGFGHAQGEDHLLEILFLVLQVEGRLAEALGPDCAKSDARFHALGFARDARAGLATLTPDFRATVLRPFAAGLTAAAEKAEALPPWTARALPVTEERVLALGHFASFLLALGHDPHGYGGFIAEAPWHGDVGRRAGAMASNAFAVAGRRTASGSPILGLNPHMALREPWLLVEAGVHGPGVAFHGFTLPGLPLPLFGFNRHAGFGVTLDYSDAFDRIFVPRGQAAPDGAPLIHPDIGAGAALALDWSTRGRNGLLPQLLAMITANDMAAFRAAYERQELPNYALTYADAAGHVLSAHPARAPKRAAALALPGAAIGCGRLSVDVVSDTTRAADTCPYLQAFGGEIPAIPPWLRREAYHAAADLPRYENPASGFIRNANSPPWFSAGDPTVTPCSAPETLAPCRDHPAYGFNPRVARFGVALERANGLTLETAAAIYLDAHVGIADVLLPKLLEAWRDDSGLSPGRRRELAQAIDLLAAWDRRATADSRATFLFHHFAWALGGYDASQGQLIEALGLAVDETRRRAGRIDPVWGEVHRLRRAPSPLRRGDPVELGVAGGFQMEGVLHAMEGPPPYRGGLVSRNLEPEPRAKGPMMVDFGTAAILVVEFLPEGPRALSSLIFGASSDPASPHFADQAREVLGRDRLKPVPFAPEAIRAASRGATTLMPR